MSLDIRIDYPPRVQLANLPTPLERMNRLSREFGVEILFKRDDLTGIELSGNKIRKLEFLLAEALDLGADTIITTGGAQSNHCRATALAATKLGLKSVLILRTPDPANPPGPEGNILLDLLAGSELVWVTPEEYADKETCFGKVEEGLIARGRKPYSIPVGGSNALGSFGYIKAVTELIEDLKALDGDELRPTTIVSATGSGGTTAGLLLGAILSGFDLTVHGINVCDNSAYFNDEIGLIIRDFRERFMPGLDPGAESLIEIIDGYVGLGYALSQPIELKCIRDLAFKEGVILDPVYTGKAFFGMTSELKKNPARFGERIVFYHTGGLFGLFPKAAEMAEVL